MFQDTVEIFRRLCYPLEPEPTGQAPRLGALPGVRAVLFDLYGTLMVSQSGEVGTARREACEAALGEAFRACGVSVPASLGVEFLLETIQRSHVRARACGVEYPEVDIVRVWREVIAELAAHRAIDRGSWSEEALRRLAVEYEGRVNPVWPMPGLTGCLAELRRRGRLLGIISNAQFYTPELFPALLGACPEDLGFDPHLQYYSYRHGRAKPGLDLHRAASRALRGRGVEPDAVLYVGNDLLNDIWPAVQVGFRTALFAGDARSLRLRGGDPSVAGLEPDRVITSLDQLTGLVK